MIIINKQFHQLAPVIALRFMPKEFQDFLLADGFTEEDIKKYADYPDLVDHDNIENDPLCKHDHSYKLELRDDKLHWIDGGALERLKGLCADAHDFKAENRLDDLRYVLAKMTHYRVDALTFPHLHRGAPWSKHHESFETELGKFLVAHQNEITNITSEPYTDVYKACRVTAIDMWYKGKDTVERLEKGEKLTDEEKLQISVICVKGIVDLWTTLANELKLLEVQYGR